MVARGTEPAFEIRLTSKPPPPPQRGGGAAQYTSSVVFARLGMGEIRLPSPCLTSFSRLRR